MLTIFFILYYHKIHYLPIIDISAHHIIAPSKKGPTHLPILSLFLFCLHFLCSAPSRIIRLSAYLFVSSYPYIVVFLRFQSFDLLDIFFLRIHFGYFFLINTFIQISFFVFIISVIIVIR